ncbi:transient receptor potential cation channel subfamily V member 6-like [Liolophura sinensis]|uniref:transient receptor potential cation channel subfamily V member 6-like n=1 Tax=Liolophura sinensis TaxID=3198878 RepID=UPI003158F9D7
MAMSQKRDNGSAALSTMDATNLWRHLTEENLETDEIIEIIRNGKTGFISQRRKDEQPGYEGRLPFHVAIAREQIKIVHVMLDQIENTDLDSLKDVFQQKATGTEFLDTVMSGQIPLSIAALTFNKEIMRLLLDYGADIDFVNGYEENVFHSLVRYCNPENVCNVWDTIVFLCKGCGTEQGIITPMWRKLSVEGHTPLTLAVLCGQHELFGKILSLQGIFERSKSTEGMSDVKEVDITEIDTLAYEVYHKTNLPPYADSPQQPKSVFKTVFALDRRSTENFVDHYAVRKCVIEKWKTYRIPYYLWACFHLLLVAIVSLAGIKRSGGLEWLHASASWIPLIFNLIYAILKLVAIYYQVKHRCSLPRSKGKFSSRIQSAFNELHDGLYLILLGVSAVTSIVDHIWFFATSATGTASHFFLVFALLSDFCFISFFVRTLKHFSFFTVMIQRVIFRDLLRFLFFIIVNIVGFTVVMFLIWNVPEEGQTGQHFLNLTVAMISLMLGLDDVSLDMAREPGLSRVVYYLFVISCYIIALNVLIALISGTCDELTPKKLVIWKIQMLSVIVFLDNIRFLPETFRGKAGKKDRNMRTWLSVKLRERQSTYESKKRPKVPKMSRKKKPNARRLYRPSATSPTIEITQSKLDRE